MCVHRITKLLTTKYGLALNSCLVAGPYCINDNRIAVSSGKCTRTATSRSIEHPHSESSASIGRRCRWHPENFIRMEGMEKSRPDSYQQSLEKQNGKWYQETARQCRGVHHAGPPHRPRDRGNWLLALRQLLVTRPGGPRRHRSLTNTQTPSESDPNQRSQHLLPLLQLQGNESRKRLAIG